MALAILAWFAAVLLWTTANRVTSASGFGEVAVETMQSPAGQQATTDALVSTVDQFASASGLTLTDRKSTRLNSSHVKRSRMPSSA